MSSKTGRAEDMVPLWDDLHEWIADPWHKVDPPFQPETVSWREAENDARATVEFVAPWHEADRAIGDAVSCGLEVELAAVLQLDPETGDWAVLRVTGPWSAARGVADAWHQGDDPKSSDPVRIGAAKWVDSGVWDAWLK